MLRSVVSFVFLFCSFPCWHDGMDFCSSGISCLCASTRRKGILLNLLILSFIRAKCSDQATKQRSSGDQVAIKEWSISAQAVFKPCSISGVPPKFWFCPNKPIEDHECITFFWITSGMNQTLQMRTIVFELLQSFNTKN